LFKADSKRGEVFIAFLFWQFKPAEETIKTIAVVNDNPSLINKDSLTIKSRVKEPNGYKRVTYKKGSFQEYLRNYKLKPFGSKIINYNDSEYFWQGGHIGVLEIPVPKNGLQQCADALIRVRSEYLWDNNRKDEIGFAPGHIVMICDEVINTNGDKLFLLFQGNTPAQSVHLVKNLESASLSPWYSLKKDAVIPVSNYTFSSSKFVRFK